MANVEQYAGEIIELVKDIEKIQDKVNAICGGSFEWGIEQVVDSYLSLFNRFCPFSVGDRVELCRTPKIDKDSGWYGCRHFIIEGSKATVRERGYSDGCFTFSVEFDKETWIDDKNKERPVSAKHTFHFKESILRKSK